MADVEIDSLAGKVVKTSIGDGGVVVSIAGDGLKLDGEEDGKRTACTLALFAIRVDFFNPLSAFFELSTQLIALYCYSNISFLLHVICELNLLTTRVC